MAAAKRAEIERRLADLQMQREREEALLKELNDRSDAVQLSAADIRSKATASTTTSSLTVFGQRLVVGDRIKTTTDQQLFRKAEAANPRRDTLKKMYLGEPGSVANLFESFHGRPAVEIEFADRTRHIFFTDCLVVGDAVERLTAAKDAKAVTASAAEPAEPCGPRSPAPAASNPRAVASGSESVAAAPSALPTTLPRRPKVIPKANAKPSSFLAELQLMADVDSDVSAAPVTPGPGRAHPDGRAPPRSAGPGGPPTSTAGPARAPATSRTTKVGKSVTGVKRPATAPKPSAVGAQPAATRTAASSAAAPTRPSTIATGRAVPAVRAEGTGPARVAAPTRVATGARPQPTAQSSGPRPVTLKVYENGSYGDLVNDRVPFRTVTVRPTFKTMGPVLSLVGQTLQWGQLGRKVEVLFDAVSGKPITSVADLQAGSPVIASMGDALIVPRANSQLFSELPEEARDRLASAPKPRTQSLRVGTSRSLPPQPKLSAASARTTARGPARAATKQATASTLLAQIEQLEGRLESV